MTRRLPEHAFLTDSPTARAAEAEAEDREARKARALTAALSAFLALAPAAGLFAWQQSRESVQLWDTDTQQPPVSETPTTGDKIRSATFGPNGGTLYVSDRHVPLRSCTVAPDRVVTAVCARMGSGGLSRADWQAYVRRCRTALSAAEGVVTLPPFPPFLIDSRSAPAADQYGGAARLGPGSAPPVRYQGASEPMTEEREAP
ncbi:hypothetical protein [Streptomyces sp. cg40]|uniref:hypothetical protein n=1 Tax=Streptomyces sp. cg40 TaxID=3419764 RepID=UPI003D0778D2